MKKTVITLGFALIVGTIAFVPNVHAQSATVQSLQAIIQQLNQQIQQIQARLLILQSQPVTSNNQSTTQSGNTTVALPQVSPSLVVPCSVEGLSFGERESGVYLLQDVLNKNGYYSEGLITGYFGPLTEGAIVRFQNANNLNATGNIDGQTQNKLNTLVGNTYQCTPTSQTASPTTGTLSVTQPKTGDTWHLGGTYRITWGIGGAGTLASYAQPIKDTPVISIYLYPARSVCTTTTGSFIGTCSSQLDVQPLTIAEKIPNAGYYDWAISQTLASVYLGQATIEVRNSETLQSGQSGVFTLQTQKTSFNQYPTISSVSGPQTIKTGNMGTWVVSASDPEGQALSYTAMWGDGTKDVSQIGNISHTYTKEGWYSVVLSVSDAQGLSVTYVKTVHAEYDASNTTTQQSDQDFMITSPQKGAIWYAGDTYTITWKGGVPESKGVTITLNTPRPACLDATPACSMLEKMPFTIASNASDISSYTWTIPTTLPSGYMGIVQISILRAGSTARSQEFQIVKNSTSTDYSQQGTLLWLQ